MTIQMTDSRLADLDRILGQFERQNVPTAIAKEMGLALVSPSAAVREAAGRWLTANASIGLGIAADESDARAIRQIQLAARQYVQNLRESNPSAIQDVPGFRQRFQASDAELNARADEAMHGPATPGDAAGNAARLAAADEGQDGSAIAEAWAWGR